MAAVAPVVLTPSMATNAQSFLGASLLGTSRAGNNLVPLATKMGQTSQYMVRIDGLGLIGTFTALSPEDAFQQLCAQQGIVGCDWTATVLNVGTLTY